jgi:hypothetical protein
MSRDVWHVKQGDRAGEPRRTTLAAWDRRRFDLRHRRIVIYEARRQETVDGIDIVSTEDRLHRCAGYGLVLIGTSDHLREGS